MGLSLVGFSVWVWLGGWLVGRFGWLVDWVGWLVWVFRFGFWFMVAAWLWLDGGWFGWLKVPLLLLTTTTSNPYTTLVWSLDDGCVYTLKNQCHETTTHTNGDGAREPESAAARAVAARCGPEPATEPFRPHRALRPTRPNGPRDRVDALQHACRGETETNKQMKEKKGVRGGC